MYDSYSTKQKAALRSEANDVRRDFVALTLKVGKNTRAALQSGLVPEELTDFNSRLVDHLNMSFWSAMISVAASDGPINQHEADYLNHIFDRNIDAFGYNETMVPTVGEMDAGETFATTIGFAIQVGQKEIDDLSTYDPQTESILRVFDRIGQGFLSSDQRVSTVEVERLSEFTAIAHAKASEFRQRIDEAIDAQGEDATNDASDHPAMGQPETIATPIEQCVAELHALVGLASVKKEVETLINLAKVFALRREKGMPVPPLSFHLVFTGNPGTGKTTVARIIAKVYGSLGLLETTNLVEVDRSGLVGNFVGQTATKTKKVLDSAKDGIFIDEAYSLSRGGENDYGSEAIEVILKRMEDRRDEFVVIVAGYSQNMRDFLQSNPGLRSRFPRIVDFPDYSADEMATIFERMAGQSGYHLTGEARPILLEIMEKRWADRGLDYANARDARNLFEGAISAQANRITYLTEIDNDVLSEIGAEDIQEAAIS